MNLGMHLNMKTFLTESEAVQGLCIEWKVAELESFLAFRIDDRNTIKKFIHE